MTTPTKRRNWEMMGSSPTLERLSLQIDNYFLEPKTITPDGDNWKIEGLSDFRIILKGGRYRAEVLR